MLIDPPLERLLPNVENRYVLAILSAKRARQLVDGAQPLSERKSANALTQASYEVDEEVVVPVEGYHDVIVPLRPEVEAERLEARRLAQEKEQEVFLEEQKLADSHQITPDERQAQERAENQALQQQNAREFTAQLLEIIGQQDEERKNSDE
ncbi:MAG: DNA-directed RNA polymerase subunit omega [Eubacteriales bacterium]|nr:DNA-directed RNA polymerase subunit omega [Eubacteriales bacterium]